jgi:diadenosine tetraphosphatase ApaH/serine/threonine PP2A family protein phosphatase
VRLAILSDIHSNLPALEAVLRSVDAAGVEEIWCLGDVVGYGASPDDCARVVEERCGLCLVGNHDLAVTGEIDVDAFSRAAGAAVLWTQENCAPETLEFLRGLEPAETGREVSLYHASPRDPVWEYVLSVDQAIECLDVQASRISLVGHSHVALFFSGDESPDAGSAAASVRGEAAPDGRELDLAEGRWLINPGSVGQPRDGDPRAAWLRLDTGDWSATYHRVEYDIDRAAAAIVAAELPNNLAERLYIGQ